MGIELTLTETPASTLLLEQPHEETNSHKLLCARPAEKEKNVLNRDKKRGEGGWKEAWHKCRNDVQSAESRCTKVGGWPLTIKSDKLWLVFRSALVFLGEKCSKSRDGRGIDGEKPHHIYHTSGTDGNLSATLETGARIASGCHGNWGRWRVERTQTSSLLPRFERSWTDTSAHLKGKA